MQTCLMELRSLSVRPRLKPLSLQIKAGEFVGLLGPNGAGKSTLLRAAAGLIAGGGESSLAAVPFADRPAQFAYLAQERQLVWPIPLRELVALGVRARPGFKGDGLAEADVVMSKLGLTALAAREVNSLSGGEKARALMARALAQNAPLLLADEPCSALDPARARDMAQLLRGQAEAGGAVLASLHDLPLAAEFCTRVLVLNEGQLEADGPPRKVLTPDLMRRVFDVGFEEREGPTGSSFVVI